MSEPALPAGDEKRALTVAGVREELRRRVVPALTGVLGEERRLEAATITSKQATNGSQQCVGKTLEGLGIKWCIQTFAHVSMCFKSVIF